MRLVKFVLFAVCLFLIVSANAQTVIENESSVILNDKTADVLLVAENSGKNSTGKITLELLDQKDVVQSQVTVSQQFKQGKETYKLSLPLNNLLEKNQSDIIWFRLRYRIGEARGILSLSEVVKDLFEIRVIAGELLFSGMNYRTRIRAAHPLKAENVQGVKINAELVLENKDLNKTVLTAQGETDREGFADLEFQIPQDFNLESADIKITGKKNGIVRKTEEDLSPQSDDFQFPIMTDKPIYQPEQMLNVRGILLKGTVGKVVVPGSEIEFRILDEEDTVLYRQKVKTSEFGIAAFQWKIPENAKLGRYQIQVRNSEDSYIGYQSIKISRYDLPNFAVSAKALKTYYLPGENEAEVEVNGDYLFGKPVTKGKVRIVRETNRKWNYKKQKYDVDEGESHEGKTDESGKFTAKFDLSEDHEDLKDNDYSIFRDLNFTAYFTDLTTNRTEQRRFDVRVTREPIHVYFIGERDNLTSKLPVNAYVSAFYADGSVCECDIEMKGREKHTDDKLKSILRTKTNSLGGAKLSFMRPKLADLDADLEFRLFAKDKNGLKGSYGSDSEWRNELDFEDEAKLEISTDKTIFKPGEAVKIKLNAAFEEDTEVYSPKVYIDIVKNLSVIESYFITLEKGKGELKIPFQPSFQGEIIIAAYFQEDNEIKGRLVKTSRGIIFPFSENLKVDASFEKETYKPGEEAKVNFSVLDSVGKAIESALGIVVFDKAVEERARNEGDFNGTFKNYYGWLGYGESFGGINVKDLNELDLSKPISNEFQLAAEIILYDELYYPEIFSSNEVSPTDAKSIYSDYFKNQFNPLEAKLAAYNMKTFEHPTDDSSFHRILSINEINFDNLRDPWEQKYRTVFEIEKTNDIVRIISAGADKKFDTNDDFTVSSTSYLYFTPTAKAVNKALKDFHARTGGYIRDEKTLFQELGISELNDRFGRPYQIVFSIQGKHINLRIWSLGKNGKTLNYDYYDDFEVYSGHQNYFQDTQNKINQILSNAKKIISTEDELNTLLKENGVDLDEIRDGYGEKIYLFKRTFTKYSNVYKEEIVSEYGKEETTKRKFVVPVTQVLISFQVRSKGADKKENTSDDFTLAEFANVISEQTKDDKQPVIKPISFVSDGTGSIQGTVKDQSGAIITGANVTATNIESSQSKSSTSDENGMYFIGNLTTGNYAVKAESGGFTTTTVNNVLVIADKIIIVNFDMNSGSVSAVVDVTSEPDKVDTTSSQVGVLQKGANFNSLLKLSPSTRVEPGSDGFQVDGASGSENVFLIDGKEFIKDSTGKLIPISQKSTPKLREYFPETLVWQPELITNTDGKAELKFKMADNITTWKLYTIASTKNGKLGVAEKEVQAFQPFFVDLDPPKFLTNGDEIYLPTQVRNYTPTKQKVDVTMAKSDWFTFLDTGKKQIEVDKNAAGNAVFGFKAVTPIKDGKQRVTAIAPKDSDAIEKPVTVRPNGEEIVRTESKLFSNSAQFEVNFPENALPQTAKAELKIYPNLMSHITESVEGLLQRPYGCGEQTISSTYPNLMLLKFSQSSPLSSKAKKYLKAGYERLLGYQIADGGFSYWGGKDESNLALTAYALRFLSDAKQFIEVDEKVLENAVNYLIKQQRADGSFYKKYNWEKEEDKERAIMTTTYFARTLAMLKTHKPILDKALGYLKIRNAELDEPYTLALYALASFDAGNFDEAEKTVEKLQILAKNEGDASYWNLESNTPFYGWGTAGRIETSALVLQALLKSKNQTPKTKDLISKGTIFLLKNKDRYGVWYSTQTTINVLDAFLASLSESKAQTTSVLINGEKLHDFTVSADQIEPIILSLNDKLSSSNQLNITSSENSPIMSQIVQTHYIDWKDSVSVNRNVNDSRAIRFDYKCDKLNAKIMETINCTVAAERIGFKGYGMLLAEIGLPPGAEVSRESLEKAFADDWSLSRYDVLPDRIVVYMWAKAGGSNFNFSFKPRYAINAKTPASKIYDYYNEESNGTVAPLSFIVK